MVVSVNAPAQLHPFELAEFFAASTIAQMANIYTYTQPYYETNLRWGRSYASLPEICAALGHTAQLNFLLTATKQDDDILIRAFKQSVLASQLDTLNCLLEFPAVRAAVAGQNNYALCVAVGIGRLDIVNRLLDFKSVVADISVNNHFLLHFAAMLGHPTIVNRLLEFPAMFSYAAEHQLHFSGLLQSMPEKAAARRSSVVAGLQKNSLFAMNTTTAPSDLEEQDVLTPG